MKNKILGLLVCALLCFVGIRYCHINKARAIFQAFHLSCPIAMWANYDFEMVSGTDIYIQPRVLYLRFQLDRQPLDSMIAQWQLHSIESSEGKATEDELRRFWNRSFKLNRSICSQIYPNMESIPSWWNDIGNLSHIKIISNKNQDGNILVFRNGKNIFCIIDEFMD